MSSFHRIPINSKPSRYKTPYGGFSIPLVQDGGGASITDDIAFAWTGNNTLNDEITGLALTNNGSVTYAAGLVNNAFEFNGSNHLSRANATALQVTDEFTLHCFYYHKTVTGFDPVVIVGKWSNLFNPEYILQIDASFQSVAFGFASGYISLSNSLTENTWYSIFAWNSVGEDSLGVRVKDMTSETIEESGPSFSVTPNVTTGTFRIGGNAEYLSSGARVDAIHKWNRKLSLSEMTSIENGTTGSEYPFI